MLGFNPVINIQDYYPPTTFPQKCLLFEIGTHKTTISIFEDISELQPNEFEGEGKGKGIAYSGWHHLLYYVTFSDAFAHDDFLVCKWGEGGINSYSHHYDVCFITLLLKRYKIHHSDWH